eukprot:2162051-Pyramimonas_sp.AAC.1
MKHLLGQESRKVRSRGRAVSCEELSKRTYQKVVSLRLQSATEIAKSAVLGNQDEEAGKRLRRVFGAMATKLAVQKRGRTAQ